MKYKHSVKDKIKQASNYYLGTWFCESESERRYKKKLQEANIDFSQQVVIGNRRVDFLVNGTEIHEINGHYHYSDSQRKKDLERKKELEKQGYKIKEIKAETLFKNRKK